MHSLVNPKWSLPARCFAVTAAAAWILSVASAQTTYVSGLQFPSKVILIPNGYLMVTETGTKVNSGRISLIAPGGAIRPLVAGLPSGLSYPTTTDPDGTDGLFLTGRVLYIVNGEGDTLRAGTQSGTTVANPQGVASPMMSSLLKVTFEQDVDQYQAPFTLKLEDHYALAMGNIVKIDDGSGKTATFEMVTNFPDTWLDPVAIYRNSHPYGLAMHPATPNILFTVDAGLNLLWQTDATTGRTKALTQFAKVPNAGLVGPPTKEAVPTNVKPCGDFLLVSLLSGGPFAPSNGSVRLVNPATTTGENQLFISNLNSSIDVACSGASYFVLEYSTNQGASPLPPGRILRYDSPTPTVLVDGLITPTSMAIDESTGTIYIVTRSDGKILTAKFR